MSGDNKEIPENQKGEPDPGAPFRLPRNMKPGSNIHRELDARGFDLAKFNGVFEVEKLSTGWTLLQLYGLFTPKSPLNTEAPPELLRRTGRDGDTVGEKVSNVAKVVLVWPGNEVTDPQEIQWLNQAMEILKEKALRNSPGLQTDAVWKQEIYNLFTGGVAPLEAPAVNALLKVMGGFKPVMRSIGMD